MLHEEYQAECDKILDGFLDSDFGRMTMMDEMHQLRDIYVSQDRADLTLAERIAPYGIHTEDDGA